MDTRRGRSGGVPGCRDAGFTRGGTPPQLDVAPRTGPALVPECRDPNDPYVYLERDAKGREVLVNTLRLRDAEALNVAADDIAHVRFWNLLTDGPSGPFVTERFLDTHRYLFADVYPWAGTVRTLDIRKSGTAFAPHARIPAYLTSVFERLQAQHEMRGLSREAFTRDAADLFGELNAIHAFREGNGRAQRAILYALSERAGHPLHFEVVTPRRMVDASVASARGDPEPFRHMFAEIADPERVRALRLARAQLKAGEMGTLWD